MYDTIVIIAGIVIWLFGSMNVFVSILTEQKANAHFENLNNSDKKPFPKPLRSKRLLYFIAAIIMAFIVLTILGITLKFFSDIAIAPMKLFW